ncbi:ABC transporter ATP-binding protein [Paracoccus sp. MBLB3053]|uniref:ABC transporter ATP-binding protein n=1 Tax=Paracoccus aurantius TaxID=3073814 RepID=A0ABU2HXY7_9RHOB|nr:ABC transporter ATP-binding protein [Paracoccus sp. MBLB3053]MDS9469592.1 ABC transporter ATP-binding protein [Paracoccus sp. MBLB3053]
MSLVHVQGVTKRFGGLSAVSDLGFALEKGEITALLGPNGSGKTTMINMISGALVPTEGQIIFKGNQIGGLSADRIARAGIARTFQLVRILPSLSLMENVMVPAAFGPRRLWGKPARDHAETCLDRVGLAGKLNLSAADLTYIDQKRLELARALAAEPDLLLLDEWLAGLNPAELGQGIDLIRRLARSGITILIVEHIMEAVRALCPRTIVMAAGRKLADGATVEVLARPEVITAYLGSAHA